MSIKRIHVAISPLTNRIYAGNVLKDGRTWGNLQTDVTGEACAAVAQHALERTDSPGVIVVTANGKPAYEIAVKRLGEEVPHD